jgi:hypothetical protein
MWTVLDPGHEHMRPGPSVGSDRSVLLAVRPDEPSDHGYVAHRTIWYPIGHLPVERTLHGSSIEHLCDRSQGAASSDAVPMVAEGSGGPLQII